MPYTICSIHREGSVLMLLGDRPPSAGLWRGIGGRISLEETPFGRVRRGVLKEAEIDPQTDRVRFAGIARWAAGVDPTGPGTGMYAFVASCRRVRIGGRNE